MISALSQLTGFEMSAGCGRGEWYFSVCLSAGDDGE